MRLNIIVGAVVAVLILASAPFVQADQETGFEKGDRTLLISGRGNTEQRQFSNIDIQAEVSKFCTDTLAVGVRQRLVWLRGDVRGSTVLATDWFWPTEQVIPYLGASGGYVYGGLRRPRGEWVFGPQLGVRRFIGENAFLDLVAEYRFLYDQVGTQPAPAEETAEGEEMTEEAAAEPAPAPVHWREQLRYVLSAGIVF